MDGMAAGTPTRSMMRNSTSGEWPPETRAVRQHEKREHRAKKAYYQQKHREAVETFRQIAGVAPESEAEAMEIFDKISRLGTSAERTRATFAVAHFCWACDEMGEDETLGESAEDYYDQRG